MNGDFRRYWQNESKRRPAATRQNIQDYIEHQMGLVELLNGCVRKWLNSETRMRPRKFEQDLRDYMDHQDKLRELTNQNMRI